MEFANLQSATMPGVGYADIGPQLARMPTLKERLEMAVTQAEERLAAMKRARELFDKNPDLEELLNIMQRSHF